MWRALSILGICILCLACHSDEPVAEGEPLSHWVSEAQQVSFFSFWNSDKDERRHRAFAVLTRMGEPAVPALMTLLAGGNFSASGDALNALAAIGPGASSAIPQLVELLNKENSQRRTQAMLILASIGPAAYHTVPRIEPYLRDSSERTARVAGMALAEMGKPGAAALRRASLDRDARVRTIAYTAFRQSPHDTAVVREFVETALADPDPTARARGVALLSDQRGPGGAVLSNLLVRAMRDSSAIVQKSARDAFTVMNQRRPSHALLLAILAGGDSDSRAEAARRLGVELSGRYPARFAADDTPVNVRHALERALEDSSVTVRVYSAAAIVSAYPEAAARPSRVLRRDLPRADIAVALRGASSLWVRNRNLPEVREFFEGGLASPDKYVRMEAMSEILMMGKAAVPLVPAIERLQHDPEREVAERAERVLQAIAAARKGE